MCLFVFLNAEFIRNLTQLLIDKGLALLIDFRCSVWNLDNCCLSFADNCKVCFTFRLH